MLFWLLISLSGFFAACLLIFLFIANAAMSDQEDLWQKRENLED